MMIQMAKTAVFYFQEWRETGRHGTIQTTSYSFSNQSLKLCSWTLVTQLLVSMRHGAVSHFLYGPWSIFFFSYFYPLQFWFSFPFIPSEIFISFTFYSSVTGVTVESVSKVYPREFEMAVIASLVIAASLCNSLMQIIFCRGKTRWLQ